MQLRSIGICLALVLAVVVGRIDAAGAVGLGEFCGGFLGIPCNAGLFCEHPAGQCHTADIGGKCITAPARCPKNLRPVCSCNGKTYANDCVRIRAGAQLDHEGRCR